MFVTLTHWVDRLAIVLSSEKLTSKARLCASPAYLRMLECALTSKVVRAKLKEHFLRPDQLSPGDVWRLVELSKGQNPNPQVVVTLSFGRLRSGKGSSFLSIGDELVKHGVNCFAGSFLVECVGDPTKPKSLENDFVIVKDGRRIPLKKILDDYFPFYPPLSNLPGRFFIESAGSITMNRATGQAGVQSYERELTTYIARDSRRIVASQTLDIEAKTSEAGLAYIESGPVVLNYHSHPNLAPVHASYTDIQGQARDMERAIMHGQEVPIAFMIFNLARVANIYLFKTLAVDKIKKLAQLGQEMEACEDNPIALKEWTEKLREVFYIIKVQFLPNGALESPLRIG